MIARDLDLITAAAVAELRMREVGDKLKARAHSDLERLTLDDCENGHHACGFDGRCGDEHQ